MGNVSMKKYQVGCASGLSYDDAVAYCDFMYKITGIMLGIREMNLK